VDTLTFGDTHDGRVREVHRQVVIFSHQLAHAWDVVAIEMRFRRFRLREVPSESPVRATPV
jgi:hypothetical protein